jgi:WD40 repeat protein
VIDALDECDKLEDIGLILRLLAGTTGLVTAKLRVFVTSRPETPIRLGFRDMPRIKCEDLALHGVSRPVVEADIYIFLTNELGEVRRKREISTDWPSHHELNLLVQKSNCLFIYAATAEPRGVLEGHSSWVNTVVFSPDGQLVVSGSGDSTVRLWDTATAEPRGVLEGHPGWVSTVVFSPDGQLVASESNDSTVRLWDAATAELRSVLEGHSGSVNTVVFSPDGQLITSGSDDGTVRLWNVNVKESIRIIERGPYDQLSFNSGSSRLHVGTKEVDTGLLTLSTLPSQSGQLLSLDVTGHWVSSATSNILWLPPRLST